MECKGLKKQKETCRQNMRMTLFALFAISSAMALFDVLIHFARS
jgi:hypothetical protein